MTNNITSSQDSSQMLVWNSVFLFLMTVFGLSVVEPMRFCAVVKEIDLRDFRRRRSSAVSVCGSAASINSYSDNASKVFNRRRSWRIWRPILPWNIMFNVFQLGDWGFWCFWTSTVHVKSSITIARKHLCRSTSVLIAVRLNAGFTSFTSISLI